MKYPLLCLTLVIAACGSSHKEAEQPNESQQAPAYYVAKYETLARPHLGQDFKVTTDIQLVPTLSAGSTAGSVGGCISTDNRIELLQSYWNAANGVIRKETLYHELAHCNQYRPHLNTTLPDGSPASLMNGVTQPQWQTYQDNEAYYENELFAVVETCGTGDALPCRTAK